MGFGSIEREGDAAPVAEINTTPLVDVMLVLLIIFIVTAPLMTQAVRVDLPRVQAAAESSPARPVTVEIDASGGVSIDGRAVSPGDLRASLSAFAANQPQPALRLQVDREARYQVLAEVMAAAQSVGLTRLAFLTDPRP
jgi:biopolymer transport protein ExbD